MDSIELSKMAGQQQKIVHSFSDSGDLIVDGNYEMKTFPNGLKIITFHFSLHRLERRRNIKDSSDIDQRNEPRDHCSSA
jgi:hypothetical protein